MTKYDPTLSDKERAKLAMKTFKEKNPNYFREYYKKYSRENKPLDLKTKLMRSEKGKKYYHKNREKMLVKNAEYRAKKKALKLSLIP